MNDVSPRQRPNGATPPISLAAPAVLRRRSMVLITGGSGFVGANLADRLAASGERVLIYDNLSRPNVVREPGMAAAAPRPSHRDRDRRRARRRRVARHHASGERGVSPGRAGRGDHQPRGSRERLRGQRARHLERARGGAPPSRPAAADLRVHEQGLRRVVRGRRACSRSGLAIDPGTACRPQSTRAGRSACAVPMAAPRVRRTHYVLDYARVFGLRTVVFRMSCLYGPRQFGTEDQGWVAHFLLRALRGAADHDLRRRQAGARSAVRRRCGRRLRARARAHRRAGRPGVQPRRRPAQRREPAGAAGALCRARHRGAAGPLCRLAARRSALLRVRHLEVRAARGLAGAHRA